MKKKLLILAAALAALFLFPGTVYAYTENDLRELMGLERIEGEKWEETAAGILAQCAGRESYNELAEGLKSTVFVNEKAKEIEDKDKAYRNYRKQFLAGVDAENLLECLFVYDSLYRSINRTADDPAVAGELERYDNRSIRQQADYAKELLALCSSAADIGEAGQDADTFLKRSLRIQDMTEDSLTCYVTEGENIYAQFNGTVSVTGEKLCIRSGETTAFFYFGVRSEVKDGQRVKQYQYIGKAARTAVTVQLKTGGRLENPLKMYGTRALYWQEEYLRTRPWSKTQAQGGACTADLTGIKDSAEAAASVDTGGSVMTDAHGNQTGLTIENKQGGNSRWKPENID